MTMIADIQDAYTSAVERAGQSAVKISRMTGPPGPPFGPFPRHGVGSGVVLDDDGHLLTSGHVVEGSGKVIVTLGDGQVLSGTVLGADEETDIAVVEVEAKGLRPAMFADSDALKVGQPVLAIGNPLGLAGDPTVTAGVVSSLRRTLQVRGNGGLPMIQTDAAVNPGSSGGPLVDLEGRVVGINNVTIPYAEGMSFAIPTNRALAVAKDILLHGHVPRSWLGIVGYDVDRRIAYHYGLASSRGVFLVEVTPKGPAEAAGLQVGDVLVALDERPLDGVGDLLEALRERKIGDTIELEVERGGRRTRIPTRLGTRPF